VRSLQRTVMFYVTIFLAVAGTAAAVTSYYFVRYEVNSFQDNALHEVALTAGLAFRDDIRPNVQAELEDQLVVQVWNRSEQLVHRAGPPFEIPYQRQLGYSDVTVDGNSFRVFRAEDSKHAIQISQRWSAREEVAAYAAAGAVLPLVASMPLAWLLIGFAVRRVLAGLGDLSADIGRRGTDAKDSLSTAGVPPEIVPLVNSMNALIERHQHALDTQRRFVSDAAHELRTPLAAIQIQADNLKAQDLPPSTREASMDLLDGIRRATYSVNQLLTMTRADASVHDEPDTIDVAVLVRMTVAAAASIAATKGVRLVNDLDDGIQLTVRSSDVRLILSNLVDNAVRYTDAGEVRITGQRKESFFAIDVADTGCGIPEAALPRIYDRFFRAAPPDVQGTGLGLSIAKTAGDRNGIRIQIRNRTDSPGVVATMEIPDRPSSAAISSAALSVSANGNKGRGRQTPARPTPSQ
jgi:two-component system, OmpR family, sensor kinase